MFADTIFERKDGVWELKISECVKLLATMYYFRYEAAFRRGGEPPGKILQNFDGRVRDYVEFIRLAVWKRGSARMDTSCPSFEAFRLQSERANSVMGYWQDGCQEEMPPREYKGKGWGIDPKKESSATDELTGENCVLWLSEHAYVGTDNKTQKVACTCSPETAARHRCEGGRCGCKGRKCSLACRCRGSCLLPAPSQPRPPENSGTSKQVLAAVAAFAALGAPHASEAPRSNDEVPFEHEEGVITGAGAQEEDDDDNWSDSDSDIVPGWGSSTSTHSHGDSDDGEWGGEWGEGGDGDSDWGD